MKLIGIPADIKDDERLRTRTLFEKCLGKTCPIAGLKNFDGLPHQLVMLDVGGVFGMAPYLETLWVEPAYLQLEESQ